MIEDRDYMRQPTPRGRGRAPVTWPRNTLLHVIVALNVVAFFAGPAWLNAVDADESGLGAALGLSFKGLAEGRFWTPLTHMFIHTGPLHLLGNMIIVYLAGARLIDLLGARPFAVIYFVGGLVGAMIQMSIESYARGLTDVPVIGASACACAVGFALAAMLPEENATSMLYFVAPVKIRLWTLAMAVMALEAVLGISALMLDSADIWWGGSAYFAHIGGAVFGWYVVSLMGYGGRPMTYAHLWHQAEDAPRPRRRAPQPAVARMRRLKNATPEMDQEAIRKKQRSPGHSTLSTSEEVDRVLEKIHQQGMPSLTDAERRLLESASKDLNERSKATLKSRAVRP